MKYLIILILAAGCTATSIEKPYIKETITEKNGNITVRETSADRIVGGNMESIKTKAK